MDGKYFLLPPIRLRSNVSIQPKSSFEGHDVACTYKVTHKEQTVCPQYGLLPSVPSSSPLPSVPSLMVVCVRRLVPLVHELDKFTLQETWIRRRYESMKEVV